VTTHTATVRAALLVKAICESTEAARKAKKGARGMAAQMLKRGYERHDDGWRLKDGRRAVGFVPHDNTEGIA
jgi:hypothetical protein